MKATLLLLLSLPVLAMAQGDQTIISVPIDKAGNTEKAIVHLPDDYSKTTTSYPIMIFLHGVGEGSLTDPSAIYNSSGAGGPAYIIAHGVWPSSFVNPADKKSYKYIVVSPQAGYGVSTPAINLEVILNSLVKTYRIDPARIYLTGLSAGGEGVLEYSADLDGNANSVNATHKVAALIPMSAVMNANFMGQYAKNLVYNKVQVWGFGSPTDTHGANTLNLMIALDALVPNYALSTAYAGGHCCWEQFYDPNYRMNGMSIYEWALQYTAASPQNPPSQPPAVVFAVPGKIEAESYNAMSGVASEPTADAGGGGDVGYIDQGDYMDYNLTVATAGLYTASFRIASGNPGASFQVLSSSGAVLASVNVPNTGGFQTWQTITANVTLPAGSQTVRLKSTATPRWNINWFQFVLSAAGQPSTPTQTPVAIPGKAEAENYSAMSGVQTETTSDAGGGLDVGWIDQGDYMDYPVNVATAGAYTASVRVATPDAGAAFQILSSSGVVLATVNVPNTGGFQTWQTATANLTLPAGIQTLRIKSTTASSWNFNWIQFAQTVVSTPTPGAAIPGTIQAESYSAMSGIGTEATADAGGGQDVGWIDNGDYMDYAVNVAAAGAYTASFRIATPNNGASFQVLSSGGAVLATVSVANTGAFQTWKTITANMTLPAGNQTLRIKSTASPIWNINWIQFAQSVVTPTGVTLPGTIQAESYSAMSGIGTEATADAGGGQDVGWIDNGDYMDYAVNVTTAGAYTASFRIATPNNGASFQVVSSSGAVLATVSVANTGGYQAWQTITANLTLPAGNQTLRIKSTASPIWNINWWQVSTNSVVPTTVSLPGIIQAEYYSAMSGVDTQATSDGGGGFNVGWVDNGDYMDYPVNVTAAGAYTAGFRIATVSTGAVLQVLSSSGTVLATVNLPVTGGFQTWQTVYANLTLPAGNQTLRIKSTAVSNWNINWIQFVKSTTAAAAAAGTQSARALQMATDSAAEDMSSSLIVFPNPVHDQLTIRINNDQTGTMLVQLTDAYGAIRGAYNFSKTAGFTQVSLSTSNLSNGIYFVRIQIGNRSEIRKIIKL